MKTKKILALLLCMVLAAAMLSGCGNKTADNTDPKESNSPSAEVTDAETTVKEEIPATRTVVDMKGAEVEIPYEVNTYIIDTGLSHNSVVAMLDGAEGILSSRMTPDTFPWMYVVCENMYKAEVFTTAIELEEAVALQPDVIFGGVTEGVRESFASVGIPYIDVSFTTYDTMIQCIKMTAEVLGEDAVAVADAYVEYLEEKIAQVNERVSALDESQRKTVVHGLSMYNLSVDGANTIIDEWINAAGGINAAAEDTTGNSQAISLEQLLAWDPDVIITGTAGEVEAILSDPNWAALTAVKNGDVYCNPTGIFYWDRYGVEEVLQFQWCAKLLYPELFEDLDITQEVKDFYEKFLHYDLSDEEATLILNHEDPVED